MSGGDTVGRSGGQTVDRDEQRARAAAAAEARSKGQNTRGQQGAQSKMKPAQTNQYSSGPDPLRAQDWD